MPTKKKEKLTPIPRPRKLPPAEGDPVTPDVTAPPPPDLSHIAEVLRPLAVPVSELQFLAKNPIHHTEEDVEATKASLRQFGQVEPLVVNYRPQPPVVLNGNGRLSAILSMGWTHVAVTRVDVDDATANAMVLVLNRTARLAGWDSANLEEALQHIGTGNDPVLESMLSGLAQEMNLNQPPSDEEDDEEDEEETSCRVLVTCADEDQRAALIERLQAEGFTCRKAG